MDTFYTIIWCSLTDWVSIFVDIAIGLFVAYVLAAIVPRKLNNERTLKDFYMHEMQDIKSELNEFCKDICLSSLPAAKIKETFKQLSIKLSDIQDSIGQNLECNVNLTSQLHELQRYITGRDEINDQYSEAQVKFAQDAVKEVGRLQELFNKNILSAIAGINKASSR